jgi:outer membrane protein assembly factor BamB
MLQSAIRCRLTILPTLLAISLAAAASCSHSGPPAGPAQLLFVTLPEQRSVAIFAADATGKAEALATIKESVPDTPVDAGVNLRGEIFVGNANATVNVYAGEHFNYQLVRTLAGPNTKMVHPTAMAVDMSGTIYLADSGGGPGQQRIVVLAAAQSGNVVPSRVVSGPSTGLTSPTGIAIDASGEVFVADHDSGKILIFAADASGNIAPVISLDNLNGPRRVAVDQYLNVLVSCDGDSSIVVFAPNGPQLWTRSATITSVAMHGPIGVASDSSGRIAAAVRGEVLFFAANANGVTAPLAQLLSPAPINPTGLLIH